MEIRAAVRLVGEGPPLFRYELGPWPAGEALACGTDFDIATVTSSNLGNPYQKQSRSHMQQWHGIRSMPTNPLSPSLSLSSESTESTPPSVLRDTATGTRLSSYYGGPGITLGC
jgi:hypothetical protein